MRGVATIAVMGGALVAAPVVLNLPVAASAAVSIALGVGVSTLACEGIGALTIAAGALGALSMNLLSNDSVMAGAAFVALAITRSMRGHGAMARRARRRERGRGRSRRVGRLALRRRRLGRGARRGARGGGAHRVGDARHARRRHHRVDALCDGPRDAREHRRAPPPRRLAAPQDRGISLGGSARGGHRVEARTHVARADRHRLAARLDEASLQGASVGVLDRRIEQHVEALERIHAAADERFARAAGLTDQRLARPASTARPSRPRCARSSK